MDLYIISIITASLVAYFLVEKVFNLPNEEKKNV